MKAFPTQHPVTGTMDLKAEGMDLRDYFAAKAMQADITGKRGEEMTYEAISTRAYEMADAMMEARKQ